jgi:hypothetical protein
LSQLREKIEKYHIPFTNIYNVDEKGFLIGLSRSMKRIVSIEALKSKRLLGSSQDGSREFITLIASISAAPGHLPPALIYQGHSHDLQDTWLDDFDHSTEEAFFASSEKGWSSDLLGLQWLKHVFDRYTKNAASRGRRLLILDGHNSHINMAFIDYADHNRIILAILPPHSTHRLQPLDIGLFSPLATYYSQEIDRLLTESQGLVSMTKRDFWRLFRAAWERAFTKENIASAFATAGIEPFNPSRVLATIKRSDTPPPLEGASAPAKTPVSTRALRRTFKRLQQDRHVNKKAEVLLRAGEKLATDNEILRHENMGLRRAIIHEKKKRKRGKAMHFLDEGEVAGQALFFSPAKIARVRQRNLEAEQAEKQRKQTADNAKLQQAIARAEKAREAEEMRIARIEARAAVKEEKLREKAEKQAERQFQRARKAEEATKRKLEAAKRKEERKKAKKTVQKVANPKKRRHEEEEVVEPQKRPRLMPVQRRNHSGTSSATPQSDFTVSQLQNEARSNKIAAAPVTCMQNTAERIFSLPMRSGRNVRLPARYR